MRHRNPNGDLTVVLDRALDLLIAELEKKRLGKTTRPKKAREAKAGHVTQAARRQVFESDGEQCTFVSGDGNRCPARAFLEVDHIHARGLGGDGSASNLRIRCRRHNAFLAEQTFGRSYIEEKIRLRQRKSITTETGPAEEGRAFDLATSGLTNIGFRQNDARRAVDLVRDRLDAARAPAPPVEQVLREALGILC